MSDKKSTKGEGRETEEVHYFQGIFSELQQRPTLLCMSGVQSGTLLALDQIESSIFVGRDRESCQIYIDSPEVSRVHAHIESNGVQSFFVVDHDSTNGVFVNGERVRKRLLQNNDKVRFGPYSMWKFFFQDVEEYEYYQQLCANASEDYLTGAMNRRMFFRILEREISFARRHQRCLTVAICDLDFFKKVNDTYGHLVGDQVLVEFVRRIKELSRQEDVLARYGGEEFTLMLREIDEPNSKVLLERLREAIANKPFDTDAGDIYVTASIGSVSCHPESLAEQTPNDMLQHADGLLYEAKENGRNQVRCKTI